jgi:hypothetical protein
MLEYWSNGDLLVFNFHYSITPVLQYSSNWVGTAHPVASMLFGPLEKAGGVHFAA